MRRRCRRQGPGKWAVETAADLPADIALGFFKLIAIRRKIVVPSLFADTKDLEKVGIGQQRGRDYAREMGEQILKTRSGT